jgi:LuxR family glucitol operon transcriptional activator
MPLKASVQGLEKIHEARIKKQWKRQDMCWCQAAIVSVSGLKRFLAGEDIGDDSFIRICQAVGIENWRDIVESSEASNLTQKISRKRDRLTTSTKSKAKIDRIDRTVLLCLPKQRLPPQTNEFLGRKSDLEKLLRFMSLDYRSPIITISGMGGVGKTALVLQAAYLCLEYRYLRENRGDFKLLSTPDLEVLPPQFEAIIFVSAKESNLLPTGITAKLKRQVSLLDIFQAIATTLDAPAITQAINPDEQLQKVREALSNQSTLLIIDNLETIEDKDIIISFLNDLPNTTTAIITSREQQVIYAPLRLEALLETDSLQLISQQANEKGVNLSNEEILQLYQRFGGVPVAMIYAIGQLANGFPFERLIDSSIALFADIGRFCFETSVQSISQRPAYQLLLAIALFHQSPRREALIAVAGLDANDVIASESITKLQRLSLIFQEGERYGMSSLTREYAQQELAKQSEIEVEMRDRWINWHLEFSKKYGGKDWGDWHSHYDYLEAEWENLVSVLDWCAIRDRYTDGRDIGVSLAYYLYLYGHWDRGMAVLGWVVESGERREDWLTVVQLKAMSGWIMLMMGQLDYAEHHLSYGWQLSNDYGTMFTRCEIADNLAILHIRKGDYTTARQWSETCDHLTLELEDPDRTRFQIYGLATKADIFYQEQNYLKAKELYQAALDLALKIQWQRYTNYTRGWLADIAIIEGDFPKAEKLLMTGFIAAERNHDRQRIAFFERCHAKLELAKGNLERSQECGIKAKESFYRLGMKLEMAQMEDFLINLPYPNP